MAIKLKDLKKATRQVHFTYAGETVNLTCRPVSPWARVVFNEIAALGSDQADLSELTPEARWTQVQARIAEGSLAMADYIGVLVDTITAWDVLADDGEPLPITTEQIERFPDEFVHALFAAAVWGGSSEAPNVTARN